MPELHRHGNHPSLHMARDPGSSPDPRPDLLQPDDLRKELELGQVGRALPFLCRIRESREKGWITKSQAADFAGRLATLVHQETGDHLLERYPDPEQLKELFKQDYLGPEAVKATWGVDVLPHLLPPQPFTDQERKIAHDQNMLLSLRVDQAPDGSPLTMAKMEELRQPTLAADTRKKLLFDTSWYQGEDFYLKDTPTLGWALTSKGVLPGSINQDYVGETRAGIRFLQESLPPGASLPPLLATAIHDFEAYCTERFGSATPAELRALLNGNEWATFSKELTNLKLSRFLRPSAPELLSDLETYRTTTGTYLLSQDSGRTRSRRAGGRLVRLGSFGAQGARVSAWMPGIADGDLGSVFSRSL